MFGRVISIFCIVMAWFAMLDVPRAYAAPGDILLTDDFDDGGTCSTLSPLWTVSDTNLSGISTQTANSGPCSLFTRGGAVSATSLTLDLAPALGAQLTLWLRRGADSFSEDTDPGEDFFIEYFNTDGVWETLGVFPGNGANGEVINLDFELPFNALHSGFQLRFRQAAGNGGPPANNGIGWDYWHVDDVEIVELGLAPPPDLPSGLGVGLCERFENGFGNWSTTNGTRAGVNGDTFASPGNSMFLRHNTVTATSISFDSDTLNEVEVWVRRGDDSFSENPDAGEDLTIEYLNISGVWVALETFTGSGTQGQIFERTYAMPASARHSGFSIRFTLSNASGSDFDYWHVDDICFTAIQPALTASKQVSIEWDPVNDAVNPLGIPGAWAIYEMTIINSGAGGVDNGSLQIGDQIDPLTTLFTGNFNGAGSPFLFNDGAGSDSSGLSLPFGGLADLSDGIIFRDSNGVSIVPNGGFDPAVASFELQFDGAMNGTASGGTPTFSVQYRVLIE